MYNIYDSESKAAIYLNLDNIFTGHINWIRNKYISHSVYNVYNSENKIAMYSLY